MTKDHSYAYESGYQDGMKAMETGVVARLRELVLDMWYAAYEGYMDDMTPDEQMAHIDSVLDRMTALCARAPDND